MRAIITLLLSIHFLCGTFVVSLYDDFTRIECTSSTTTCTDPYCDLNQDNDPNTTVSFGCDLQRSLSPVYFRIQFYKLEHDDTYELVASKKVDFCDVLDHPENYVNENVFDFHVKFTELTFTGLIHKCPFTEIKVVNGTRQFATHSWPSGRYKTITTIMDDHDENVFQVTYYEDLQTSIADSE